jgi:methyl-accepting chemotaxis protein
VAVDLGRLKIFAALTIVVQLAACAAAAWFYPQIPLVACLCALLGVSILFTFQVVLRYGRTVAGMEGKDAGKRGFADIMNIHSALAENARRTMAEFETFRNGVRVVEARPLSDAAAGEGDGEWKSLLLSTFEPFYKIFFYRENDSTVIDHVDEIVKRLFESIKNTIAQMDRVSDTLSLTFEAFDITSITMEQVDRIITQASELTSNLRSSVGQGRDAILTSRDSMALILDFSQKMANIVTTIEDISDETNVLAINAAIESSRAGLSGKGFGVIASEIRKLATNTRESSQQIKNLIDEMVRKIDNQARLIQSVHDTFSVINEFIGRTMNTNDEIYKISRKNVIQSKEIQTVVNFLKDIAKNIISTSGTEIFEANEVVTIMRSFRENLSNDKELGERIVRLYGKKGESAK